MGDWWASLTTVNQVFYAAAIFFSVLFLWQLIAVLVGLAGGEEAEVHGAGEADLAGADIEADHDFAPGEHPEFEHGAQVDGTETMVAFKLLSLRSIMAFCTLFTWAGALYLNQKKPLSTALSYSVAWGLAAMLVVAALFYLMRRLTESGTPRLSTCVGTRGVVYLAIPPGGVGEVRVTVSGAVTHVKARGAGGAEIPPGTPVRVRRIVAPHIIEVEPLAEDTPSQGTPS